MRKTLLIALFTLFSIFCSGQESGPLRFLGIPIDGMKDEFVTKLKSKGFVYSAIVNGYKGEFNGKNVNVFVHTNHNLVDRVFVEFPYTDEIHIRTDYNLLLIQLRNTGKYMDFVMNEPIPKDDDILYEISVNNKSYEACFSYFDSGRDKLAFTVALIDKLSVFFTVDQRDKLREYAIKSQDASEGEYEALFAELVEEMQKTGFGKEDASEFSQEQGLLFIASYMDAMRSLADGEVWFTILESAGRYQIGLYYDNLHNKAHGEDL